MDVMKFLAKKSVTYQEKFLAAVTAHRDGDTEELNALVDQLMEFHPVIDGDTDTTKRFVLQLIDNATESSRTDEMAMESYANFGPRN